MAEDAAAEAAADASGVAREAVAATESPAGGSIKLSNAMRLSTWALKNLVAGPLLKSIFRPWVVGVDRIPREGPVILASNHLSITDAVFLPVVIRRRVSFLAKREYFIGRGFVGLLMKALMHATGQVQMDRSGGRASEDSLNSGLAVLSAGEVLGIYPEGSRSPDGVLYRGRTGIARLILEAQVPVFPVAMIGTDKILPVGSKLPKVRRVGVVVGPALDYSRFHGMEADRAILRSVTDDIMHELFQLGGQRYEDIYASSAKTTRPSLNH